jgi:hypothetical protein
MYFEIETQSRKKQRIGRTNETLKFTIVDCDVMTEKPS